MSDTIGARDEEDRLEVRSRPITEGAALRLAGELTVATVQGFVAELHDAETPAPGVLAIDLRDVTFLDSTALGTLIAADNRSREAGRRLMVVIAPGPVARLLEVTRLDRRLEIVDEPPEVIESPRE